MRSITLLFGLGILCIGLIACLRLGAQVESDASPSSHPGDISADTLTVRRIVIKDAAGRIRTEVESGKIRLVGEKADSELEIYVDKLPMGSAGLLGQSRQTGKMAGSRFSGILVSNRTGGLMVSVDENGTQIGIERVKKGVAWMSTDNRGASIVLVDGQSSNSIASLTAGFGRPAELVLEGNRGRRYTRKRIGAD